MGSVQQEWCSIAISGSTSLRLSIQPDRHTQWLLLPSVNVDLFTLALQHFAQAVGASKQKQIVLVLDRARWHTSKELTVPEGLHLPFRPPSSPELQPAEHLWPLSNQPLVDRHFHDLDELEEVQAQRCVFLRDSPDLIRSHTSFRLQVSPL